MEPPISPSDQYLVFLDPFVDPPPPPCPLHEYVPPHIHACRGHPNTPELRNSTQHSYNEPIGCAWNHSLDCRSSITCSHPPPHSPPPPPPSCRRGKRLPPVYTSRGNHNVPPPLHPSHTSYNVPIWRDIAHYVGRGCRVTTSPPPSSPPPPSLHSQTGQKTILDTYEPGGV